MKSFSLFFAMLLILIAVVGGASHQQITSPDVPVLSAAQRIERLSVPAPVAVPLWMVTNMEADSANIGKMVSAMPDTMKKDAASAPSAMREEVAELNTPKQMATQNMVLCARVDDLAESAKKLDRLVTAANGIIEEDVNIAEEVSEKSITQKIMLAPEQLEGFLKELNKVYVGKAMTKVVKAQKNAETENISSLIMVNQQSLSDMQELKRNTKNVAEKLMIEEEIRKVSSQLATLNTQKEMALQQGANCVVLVNLYQDLTVTAQNASIGELIAAALVGGLGNARDIFLKLVANWPFLVIAFIFLVWHFLLSGSEKRRAQKAKMQEEFERALIGTQVAVTR